MLANLKYRSPKFILIIVSIAITIGAQIFFLHYPVTLALIMSCLYCSVVLSGWAIFLRRSLKLAIICTLFALLAFAWCYSYMLIYNREHLWDGLLSK